MSQSGGAGGSPDSSVLLTDDVILLAPWGQDIQPVLEQIQPECEAAGIRIDASMSEAPGSQMERGGLDHALLV